LCADVGLGEASLHVAALVLAGAEQLAAADRLVGIEQGLELLPLDLDQRDGLLRLLVGVGAHGRDGRALVAARPLEPRRVAGADRTADAGCRQRRHEVEAPRMRTCKRRAEDGCVEHSRQAHVGGVERLAPGASGPVDALRRPADDGERAGGPLRERVFLDEQPYLLVATLDFLLGADQSRHVRIASSIFGYVPQRQRLPAIA